MTGARRPSRASGRARLAPAAAGVTAVAMVVAALVGLVWGAVDGNRTVGVQRDALTRHDAALDDAFYRCIDVQARSLVSPGEPVTLTAGLGDLVTLIKGVGSWVTVADPPSRAVARLSLRDNVTGKGACLGTVVTAATTGPGGRVIVRIGSGASVPGHGPPPAPPL